jgi:serine/threonine-protein kinase
VDLPDRAHTLRSIEPPGRDALVGTVLHDRYRILGRLGAGGMGVVYRGEHEVLKTPLAVKVLHPHAAGDGEAMERFRREAQAASAVGSEHIVEVRDFGKLDDDSTYIVMELIEGRDLYSIVRQAPLAWARVRDIALQLCEALGKAHERGIVHRDLKLENVLLTQRNGRSDFVKLVDFGIAKVQGSAKLTVAGRVMGTPEYMSPEQCAARSVDHRTDIYAFGVMLYEMSTGRLPFQHSELGALLRMHIHDPPPPPSSVAPELDIPLGLEAVILRCLAKNPAARFQSMDEIADALRAIEGGTVEAYVDRSSLDLGGPTSDPELTIEVSGPATPRIVRPSRTRSVAFAAIGVGSVALVAIGLVAWNRWRTAEASPPNLVASEALPVAEPEERGTTALPMGELPPPPSEPAEARFVAPARSAEIILHSDPEGAQVLDSAGALLGVTPFRLPRPDAGQRTALELRRDGYAPYSVLVNELSAAELVVPLARRERRTSPTSSGSVDPSPADPVTAPRRGDPPSEPPPRREFLDPWGAR